MATPFKTYASTGRNVHVTKEAEGQRTRDNVSLVTFFAPKKVALPAGKQKKFPPAGEEKHYS